MSRGKPIEKVTSDKHKQVLITYISYDQDDYDFKKSDHTFMLSHKKALCEKGYIAEDEIAKISESEISRRTDYIEYLCNNPEALARIKAFGLSQSEIAALRAKEDPSGSIKPLAKEMIKRNIIGIENILTRHDIWRPTIALAIGYDQSSEKPDKFPPIHFDKIFLLYNKTDKPEKARVAKEILCDLEEISKTKHFEIEPIQHDFESPFRQAEVYEYLYTLLQEPRFHESETDYFVNVGNGTNAIKNSLFLLTHDRQIIAKRIIPHPWGEHHKSYRHYRGWYQLDDPAEFDAIYSSLRQKGLDSRISAINRGIETKDEKFKKLLSEIATVSKVTRNPILLTGASGSGKTQIAKNIFHALAKDQLVREDGFQHLNCATLRGDANITKSTLFGHAKGGYTGADADKDGALKLADKGVLFLDEIGTLGMDEQAMLLTAIEDKKFLPLGGSIPVRSDFRLICGTNTNLWEAVKNGSFRRDLFERINLWHFQLPSLKDRISEIMQQCRLFLDEFYPKRSNTKIRFQNQTVENEFEQFISDDSYDWPGNFRELNAIMERMCEMATLSSNKITHQILSEEIERTKDLRSMANDAKPQQREIPAPIRESAFQPTSPKYHSSDLYPNECISLIGEEAYRTLSRIQLAELELIVKTIKNLRITDQRQLCRAIYGENLTPSGLTRRLRTEFNLSFSHGKLSPICGKQ